MLACFKLYVHVQPLREECQQFHIHQLVRTLLYCNVIVAGEYSSGPVKCVIRRSMAVFRFYVYSCYYVSILF